MDIQILLAFIVYFACVFCIGLFALKKSAKSSDFSLGNRSTNYWVTGISAHASEMSGWLFMGYPAMVMATGLMGAWTAIGLVVFMFLNWHFIAKKLRVETARTNSLTLSTFFEKRFGDRSGLIRLISAFFCLLFFTFYISASLVELGRLFQSVLGINYHIGITVGIIVVFYTLLGGYLSMVWIDFFQGLFLLVMILLIPLIGLIKIGGLAPIQAISTAQNIPFTLFPDFSYKTISSIIFAAAGWGLGYFGQPHILTKFMGIQDADEIKKAKYLGISWQILVLFGATLVALVGIAYFTYFNINLPSKELVYVMMVKDIFPPFIAGFILCAIIAAAINVISAQILVLSSTLTEDLFKKMFVAKTANMSSMQSANMIKKFSQVSVLVVCVIAYCSAFSTDKPIFDLVYYAWTGLGASFGPLIIMSLYSKMRSRYAAIAGLLIGGLTAAFWPATSTGIPAMIVAYILSFFVMIIGEKLDRTKITQDFDSYPPMA